MSVQSWEECRVSFPRQRSWQCSPRRTPRDPSLLCRSRFRQQGHPRSHSRPLSWPIWPTFPVPWSATRQATALACAPAATRSSTAAASRWTSRAQSCSPCSSWQRASIEMRRHAPVELTQSSPSLADGSSSPSLLEDEPPLMPRPLTNTCWAHSSYDLNAASFWLAGCVCVCLFSKRVEQIAWNGKQTQSVLSIRLYLSNI